jgi:hypothetical protein
LKTARSIEEQTERKKDEKNTRSDGDSHSQNSVPVSVDRAESRRRQNAALKPYHFKPGQSGNPGGRPKVDVASEIARALFENDGPAIYAAFQKVLRKGSPYGFQVLADRAFGKLKEVHQIDHSPYREVSDEDLQKHIAELKAKLGWPGSEPKILPPADKDSKIQ